MSATSICFAQVIDSPGPVPEANRARFVQQMAEHIAGAAHQLQPVAQLVPVQRAVAAAVLALLAQLQPAPAAPAPVAANATAVRTADDAADAELLEECQLAVAEQLPQPNSGYRFGHCSSHLLVLS